MEATDDRHPPRPYETTSSSVADRRARIVRIDGLVGLERP